MSAKMLLGLLLATTFLQMKLDRVGSSSPMYSTIFLLTQGFILRSINVCRKIFNNSKTNINQKNTDDKQSTRIDMCSHKYTGFTIKAKRQHYSWAASSIGKKELKWTHQNKQAADLIYGLQTRITQIFYKKLATELTNRPENKTKENYTEILKDIFSGNDRLIAAHWIDHGPVQFVRKQFVFCGWNTFDQILNALSLLLGTRRLHWRRQNGRLFILRVLERNELPSFCHCDFFVIAVEYITDRHALSFHRLNGAVRRTWKARFNRESNWKTEKPTCTTMQSRAVS